MYPQTLYPKTKQVLDRLKEKLFPGSWYLAGGTALALQLGHRKSVDLDYFTPRFPKRDLLLSLIKDLKPKIIQEAPGTLDTTIEGVKVSFLEYKYPLLEELKNFEGVPLAGVLDIACMKVSAISSRGSKKDFIDLFFVLEKYDLNRIFEAFNKKFKSINYQKLHLIKSISYFTDAQEDPDPDMANSFDWEKVKSVLEKKVKKYLDNRI